MRFLLAAGGVVVLAAFLFLSRALVASGGREARAVDAARPSAGAPVASGASEERVAALERRVNELAQEIGALREELERLGVRREPVAPESPPAAPEGAAGVERGPRWYLEQYVASFADGGRGSEYFRLAVEAFAPSLLREIGAIVLDARANATLRLRLVEMLGDARFRGQGPALDVLLRLLPLAEEQALVTAALRALGAIGDERTARALEGLVWTLRRADARFAAIQTLVQLAGADANAALVRLWSRAADSLERSILVGHALPNEGESSLALFELASFAEQPVRLQAALAIGQFRFPGFAALIAGWKARETDPEVRAALGASEEALSEPARWSAERAAGPPDASAENDDPNAWASQKPDMGLQWLELGYDPPLRASGVRIFEVCVPGAVAAVTAVDERGGRHELWSGDDPTASPGVFELEFPATSFRVRALRLTLDTDRRPGWSEIDAVELLGPDGRAWAATASASSSYGR